MSLALQASNLGYHTHAMAGIDYQQAYQLLHIDRSQFQIIAAFALGVRGEVDVLPPALQEKESPSQRLPLEQVWLAQGEPGGAQA